MPQRGGSNEYSQSMFLSKIRKNNDYPCKPQFYYKKNWLFREVGGGGGQNYIGVFWFKQYLFLLFFYENTNIHS